jgi:hypothetical protein
MVLIRKFGKASQGTSGAAELKTVRFCKLAGCIVVNYKENDHIKVISEEYL